MKMKSVANRRGLLAAGTWVVDHVKMINVYPQKEKLATILSQSEGFGGAPHNVLVDLAASEAPFPLMAAGLVGKDEAGLGIIETCRSRGIDVKHLTATPKAPTAFTDVMSEVATGRRTFFCSRGANALWTGADLDFSKIKAKLFHLGYLLLMDALDEEDFKFGTRAARLLAAAQEAGMKTSIDIVTEDGDRFTQVVVPALKFTDYCIINEVEAGRITGFKLRQPDGKLDTVAVRHASGALLQQGVRELVVVHFPEGAFARTRKGEDVWQSALKLPPKSIVSNIGAGDAFCAGVLLGLHEGWELARCLQTAVCVAGACLLDATATGGVKSLADSLALAKKFKFHKPLESDF
jgi:sugar/nucleoside kinase (ribokinase family)